MPWLNSFKSLTYYIIIIFIVFQYLTVSQSSATAGWSYNNPSAWADLSGSSCGGNHQSPINIQPSQSVRKSFPKFAFQNYGNIDKVDLINNGHTAVYSLPVNFPADRVPSITGGGLNDTYKFVQFHLHWGSDSSKGSEHLIRSRSHPAELHMVHYNTKYGTYADATTHSDGLAVLGVFLKVADNDAFRPLVEQLSEVPADGDETTLKNLVSLKDLLPAQTTSFYRYSGSLTTPKCNQIVTWTVFDNPLVISEQQLKKFRSLKNDVEEPLVNNFRPVQPLNDRTVLYRSITGCEIPRSWPISWTPLLDAIKWSQCIIGFTLFRQ
ncbi:alpha-carbonic anhydrase [Daphnia pulex]|uniref:Carbonic anhydrase n=1 Tax=Daphnia pulex TaxID=6669 RepID=E9FX48_DAPPU|nr:alpha-carbonic anhydrase [Daphnia pulex]|eukprot:EFX88009.1 alpha-carbonic anhydrase [Daphnia pulex]